MAAWQQATQAIRVRDRVRVRGSMAVDHTGDMAAWQQATQATSRSHGGVVITRTEHRHALMLMMATSTSTDWPPTPPLCGHQESYRASAAMYSQSCTRTPQPGHSCILRALPLPSPSLLISRFWIEKARRKSPKKCVFY